MSPKSTIYAACFFVFLFIFSAIAQDERAQLPPVMRNSFFEVTVGAINYPFSKEQLAPGFSLISEVEIPHTAVRLVIGHEFNKYFAAQVTYMRPVMWVKYIYSYDDDTTHFSHRSTVWMNVGGVTFKPQLPIGDRFTLYGETGLGIITRHGFGDSLGNMIVSDANYGTVLFGGGIKYHVNKNWTLMAAANFSPEKKSVKQPSTSSIAAGFSYKLLPKSVEQLEYAAKLGYIHPKHLFQIGYASNVCGYGVNNFVANDKFPIFWGGGAQVRQGLSLSYQKNVFHTAKVFSLDWGVSAGFWQSNIERQSFITLSAFPVLRFTFLHTRPLDAYFYYSIAGPTYISRTMIDGENTGEHFTFQDNMGTGVFFGKRRNQNVELKIGHYSNGNVFSENDAVKIPLSLILGYAF